MVFESISESARLCNWTLRGKDLQPTIQERKFLHRGDDNECVQKYNCSHVHITDPYRLRKPSELTPPDVGAAEPSSAIDMPTQRINKLATAHCRHRYEIMEHSDVTR